MKVEAKQNLGLLPMRAVSFSFRLLEWQGLLRGKRIKTGDVSPGLLRYWIPLSMRSPLPPSSGTSG